MIEVRALTDTPKIRRRRQAAAARSGASKMSTCCRCGSSWWPAKIGGQVFGAFDGQQHGRLLPGNSRPEGRRQDLSAQPHAGRAAGVSQCAASAADLKLAQRDDALARGIDLIEWTFDPLEIKNAFFNMERLGAIVRRYVPNQYGTTTSPLHGGLPTDRCIAEWWISSPRAKAIIAGERFNGNPVEARISIPSTLRTIRTDRSDARPRHPARSQRAVSRRV